MPERGIDFLNALFHGLDFRKLGAPLPFTALMFVYPLGLRGRDALCVAASRAPRRVVL